jgi:hypothetical protein
MAGTRTPRGTQGAAPGRLMVLGFTAGYSGSTRLQLQRALPAMGCGLRRVLKGVWVLGYLGVLLGSSGVLSACSGRTDANGNTGGEGEVSSDPCNEVWWVRLEVLNTTAAVQQRYRHRTAARLQHRCNAATRQRCNDATLQRCNNAAMQQYNDATMQQCNNAAR